MTINAIVLEPSKTESRLLTQEDVWGRYVKIDDNYVNVNDGMIVANHSFGGYNKIKAQSLKKCPIFKDYVGYKSVTVVCDKKLQDDVEYWLEFVHGGGSIQKVKDLKDKVGIRSDYMCW